MRHLFLGAHPQTLRRRLQSEGTNFQTLKNESRRDLAIYRLAKSDHSAEDIARECGFSEPNNFNKSWTGITPYSDRKK
ncbi:MAG: helix-turn-helix domain-containing protein [Marinomonas gallaica]|jgi:AraC-like DNA-binding protein